VISLFSDGKIHHPIPAQQQAKLPNLGGMAGKAFGSFF